MATILIVDDRPSNRVFLVTLLGYSGHRLLEAADGAEALATAKAVHLDLVIADILMPTMDGYEFVRRLRADPVVAGIPVIFCTAHYHEREGDALAKACGVAHVLYKPCEPELVLRTVNAALGVGPPTSIPPLVEEFDRDHLRLLTDKLSQKADELRKANARLTALIDLGLQLGSERDPRQLLQTFCHAARDIIGARYTTVGIPSKDGSQVSLFFTSGMDADTGGRLGAPTLPGHPLRAVLEQCCCVRAQNAGGDPQAVGLPSSYPPVNSFLGAPLVSPARVYGWLCLLDKIGAEEFSDDDERVAGILAAQVGRIYENGSLYSDLVHQASKLNLEVVAERKRAEEALRASEEHTHLILDTANDPFITIRSDGRILDWNRQAELVFGWSRTEALDRMLSETIIPAQHREAHVRGLQTFLATGQGTILNRRIEITALRRDGHEFPVEVMVWPTRVRETCTISAFVRDITERKQAEEALRASEERIRLLLDSTAEAIYGIDLEGNCTFCNRACARLLGYAGPDQLLGKRMHALMHHHRKTGEPYPVEECKIYLTFRHGEGTHVDDEVLWRADGTSFAAEYWSYPIRRAKEIVGSVVTFLDISERKKLEDRYRQSQKMEAVGRLAGGVAHDFNNLLTVINGYSDLLIGGLRAGDPLRQSLEQIHKAGERAATLTRQLLAFSRKQVLVLEVLDVNVLLAEMEKMLSRLISEDIELRFAAEPALWQVKVDPGQIEQVIMNLVVNARDAMPEGGKLTIETANVRLDETYTSTHPDIQPGKYVLMAVSDTGCGMDEATKARIFEPFFTTKSPEKGTGLGLATVYGIIKQSGGRIDVYTEPGVGTTFKVYLPRAPEEALASRPSAVRPALRRGTETVLLVEDEDGVRKLALRILQMHGYKVLEACNGGEAFLLCREYGDPINILVTDVVMPKMSGRQLAEQLAPLRPDMKVLYLSGYTGDAIVHHGVLDPHTPFLQKPFRPDDLARKVRETLDH